MKKLLLFALAFITISLNAQYIVNDTLSPYWQDASECEIDISNNYAASNLIYYYPINIYEFSSGNWTLHQQIYIDSCSVNIACASIFSEKRPFDLEGNILVIGLQFDSLDYAGLNPQYKSGSVLIYSKKSNGYWSFDQKISPSNRTSGLEFGLDLSTDGTNLVVKSKDYIYFYEKNTNGSWVQTNMISAGESSGVGTHYSNLISVDSNILAFGFYTKDTIKVYEKVSNTWQLSASLVSPDSGAFKDCFVSNNTIYIGDPSNSYDSASANYNSGAGAVFAYEKNTSGTWVVSQKIVSPNRTQNGSFGESISIYNDRLAVGAPKEGNFITSPVGQDIDYQGAIYVYKETNANNYNLYSTLVSSNYKNLGTKVAIDQRNMFAIKKQYDMMQYSTGSAEGLYTFIDTNNLLYQNTLLIDTCRAYTNQFGTTYYNSGIYNHIINNPLGDSVFYYDITINRDTSNVNITACDSFVSPSGNFVAYSSGLYTDTLFNIDNCDSVVYYNVTIPVIDTSVTVLITTNDEVILSSNAVGCNYLWYDCQNNIPTNNGTDTLQTFFPQPISIGYYSVIIDIDGCQDTSNCHIVITEGINVNDYSSKIKLYPNPSKDFFYLQSKGISGNADLKLSDIQGREVLSKQILFKQNKQIKINTSNLSKGVYIIKVQNTEGIFTSKIIIE